MARVRSPLGYPLSRHPVDSVIQQLKPRGEEGRFFFGEEFGVRLTQVTSLVSVTFCVFWCDKYAVCSRPLTKMRLRSAVFK